MKIYLENLNSEQLMELVENNSDLRNMLEDEYIDNTMNYVNDITHVLGGQKWDIGFYNWNYWTGIRSKGQLENIIDATDDFGLCSEEEIEKVKYCIKLIDRRECMDWNNKQIDNIESKIYDLFNEIDDIVTNNLNRIVDENYINNDVLLDVLECMLDFEEKKYYIIENDKEKYNVYRDKTEVLS